MRYGTNVMKEEEYIYIFVATGLYSQKESLVGVIGDLF